jgi:hypothetical protein
MIRDPESEPLFPELAEVRTLRVKVDSKGRSVPAGTRGRIVFIHGPGSAYTVEVSIVDERGVASDSHLFEAAHDELELSRGLRR